MSLISIYDILYIVHNYSDTECTNQFLYWMIFVIDSIELLTLILILYNVRKIIRFILVLKNCGIMIDSKSDLEIMRGRLDMFLIIQSLIISIGSVPSFWMWNVFYPENCNVHWFQTIQGSIFYVVRILSGWSWVVALLIMCIR